MLVKQLLFGAKKTLTNSTITSTPDLDASLLLMHALGFESIEQLIMHYNDEVTAEHLILSQNLIARRLRNEPIAYITGKKFFWDHEFIVTPDVLIPRPETEFIIEGVLKHFPTYKQLSILDLGTGSGCIPITLLTLYKNSHSYAVDISSDALHVAKLNAVQLHVTDRIHLIESNWFNNIPDGIQFDIITANPPYISLEEWNKLDDNVKLFEPKNALTDYLDGLNHYREILSAAPQYMTNECKIFFEIGYDQLSDMKQLIELNNMQIFDVIYDLSNIPRILCAIYKIKNI